MRNSLCTYCRYRRDADGGGAEIYFNRCNPRDKRRPTAGRAANEFDRPGRAATGHDGHGVPRGPVRIYLGIPNISFFHRH